jgi:hypothetical protein
MKTKTAYRVPKNIPAEAPNIEIKDDPPQPSESVKIEFTNNKADPTVGIVSADEIPSPDEATLTLQKQIADLKKSEQMQLEFAQHVAAQRAAQMAAPEALPSDPEARIALWRTQGLDEGDAAFLSEHLEMADRPDLTRLASDEAAQHHQRGTDDHRRLTKEIFDQHLALQQAAPAASAAPAPAFFAPPPQPQARAEPSALYSAPVSRQAQSASTGQRPQRTIRLTAEEQEYARVAGVSDVEYARQKQKLAQAKANGDYGERR